MARDAEHTDWLLGRPVSDAAEDVIPMALAEGKEDVNKSTAEIQNDTFLNAPG
jgi:hypothetical protein